MNLWRKSFFFYVGGMLYCGLELLWRGRTHGSMFLLGGICFLFLGKIGSLRCSIFTRAMLGGLAITASELAMGLLVNQRFQIWDYRSMPMNFRGQICPLYSLFWIFLSPIGFFVYQKLEKRLQP